VPVKSEARQAGLTVQCARGLLVTERTALANQIRGLLLEYGVVITVADFIVHRRVKRLIDTLEEL
jgi:transposase